MRHLEFAVTVEDSGRLTDAQKREVEECEEPGCDWFEDHVMHLLDARMREAGEKFCESHPNWFRVPLT